MSFRVRALALLGYRCLPKGLIPHSPLAAGIDEVNLFKDDDTVIHFSNPKVQMSNGTNTFVVSGTAGAPSPVCTNRFACSASPSFSH